MHMIATVPSRHWCITDFLNQADEGLRGTFVSPLGAVDILQLLRSCRVAQGVLCGTGGVCCPHLRLQSDAVLANAAAGCDAQQVRSIWGSREYLLLSSAVGLKTLAARMKQFVSLQALGHLSLDLRSPTDPSESHWFPELLSGLANCKALACLDIQLAGVGRAEAQHLSQALPIGLGGCASLQNLKVEIDGTMDAASCTFRALAAALSRLAAAQSPAPGAPARLKMLSLGYLWWSEAQESTMQALQSSLETFNGSIRVLEVRYPADQALGALEVVANHAVLGVAQGVEILRVEEGWDSEGGGLDALAEVLPKCRPLNLIELVGDDLPVDMTGTLAEEFRTARTGLQPATLEWKCRGTMTSTLCSI